MVWTMHKLLPQMFLSLLIFDGLTAVHILWRSNTDIPLDDLDLFPQNLIRFLVEFHTLWQFTLGIFFTKYNKNPFRRVSEMVFCYQYCSDLLWEKIVLVIEKNFWNFEFSKILRSLEQFIQTVKGQNNFW